jgi:hypothetical protein
VNTTANIFNSIVGASVFLDFDLESNNLTPEAAGISNWMSQCPWRSVKNGDYIWLSNKCMVDYYNDDGYYGFNQLARAGLSLWKVNTITDRSFNCTRVLSLGGEIHPCLVSASSTINFVAPDVVLKITLVAFNLLNIDNTLVRSSAVTTTKLQSLNRQGNVINYVDATAKSTASTLEFVFVMFDSIKIKPEHFVLGTNGSTLDPSVVLTQLGLQGDRINMLLSGDSSSSSSSLATAEYHYAFAMYNQLWNTIKFFAVIVELLRFNEMLLGNFSVLDRNSLSLVHFQKRGDDGSLHIPENCDELCQLLLNFENVLACCFARSHRGCTQRLRNRIQDDLSQLPFNMGYLNQIVHKNLCIILYNLKTSSATDLSCILDVKEVSNYLSNELFNIKFCLNEQSQLFSGAKKVYNLDRFSIVLPVIPGKPSKKSRGSNAGNDTDSSDAGVIAAKVLADSKIAKAAAAAAALALANAGSGIKVDKSGGVLNSTLCYCYLLNILLILFG